jgi:hypothetical protein
MTTEIPQSDDIRAIFDALEQDRISLWDVIRAFSRGRDVSELELILNERPERLPNILYIMHELPAQVVAPLWRIAADHVSDPRSAYYAICVIEMALPRIAGEEAEAILNRVEIDSELMAARVEAIRSALAARGAGSAGP